MNLHIDQIVDMCIRYRIGNAPSKLDLCFIKNIKISQISYLQPLGKSDHLSLLVNINLNFFNQHGYIKRLWNKADFNKINLELSKIDWDKELLGKNMGTCGKILKTRLISVLKNLFQKN